MSRRRSCPSWKRKLFQERDRKERKSKKCGLCPHKETEERALLNEILSFLGISGISYPRTTPRAGYRSKFFDTCTNTDTFTSIPVPERYVFRYLFYNINSNKKEITHNSTNLQFYFSAQYFNFPEGTSQRD